MSTPEDQLFSFDLGDDDGVPVESLGELIERATDEDDDGDEGSKLFGADFADDSEPELTPLPGTVTIESRPTGSGQAPVTAVATAREPTEEEIAEAFNKLTPGQQANYRARPWLWAPGAFGHPGIKKAKAVQPKKGRKANRVNVRDIVDNICGESGLDPFSVLALLMMNDEPSRIKLGLTEKDKVSTMLRAKCAMELAGFMSPKLKSIEIKDEGHKPAQVQVFLPANGREGEGAALIRLPIKDGQQVEMSPSVAAELINAGLVDVPDQELDAED